MMRRTGSIGLAVAGCLVAASPALAAPVFELVSVSSRERPGNDLSFLPDVSAGGRYVVFQSSATNLAGKGGGQVYLRDLRKGRTRAVSRSSSGKLGTKGAIGAAISPNGRFVAFCSQSPNLVKPDRWRFKYPFPNKHRNTDVFVRDLARGETRRASTTYRGGMANHYSCEASVADNGDVVFSSLARNLVRHDDDRRWDVFHYSWRRDRLKMVEVVSRRKSHDVAIQGGVLSGDGSVVAVSVPTADPDKNPPQRFYLYFPESGRGVELKRPSQRGAGGCWNFRLSRSGRYIAMECNHIYYRANGYSRSGGEHAYRFDRRSAKWRRLTPGPAYPDPNTGVPDLDGWDLSLDGRFFTWCGSHTFGRTDDRNFDADIHVRNLVSGRWVRVAGNPDYGASIFCHPRLAEDGRIVVFSAKSPYVRKDDNETGDVYAVRKPLRKS